jgi:hypothetical protein
LYRLLTITLNFRNLNLKYESRDDRHLDNDKAYQLLSDANPLNLLQSFIVASIGRSMKSWAGKALETLSCVAFLKCKLTVVIRAC